MVDDVVIESILITEITDSHYQLLKLALKVLGNYSNFDSLKIYESKNSFEIITICLAKKYVTRTYIGKYNWRVQESYCKMTGEEEIEIYKRKK